MCLTSLHYLSVFCKRENVLQQIAWRVSSVTYPKMLLELTSRLSARVNTMRMQER